MNVIRIEKMLDFINKQGAVSIKTLCKHFPDVTYMTVHRDLSVLEKEGAIIRIRGGVKAVNYRIEAEEPFGARKVENKDAKTAVAFKACNYVNAGDCIYIDSGTTGLAFAKAIPDTPVNVFTCAPNIAVELAQNNKINVTVCGGKLNKRSLTLCGKKAIEFFDDINIDTAFIATSGYTLETGFSCGSQDEAELKRSIIKKAKRVIILMDIDKVGRSLPYTFAKVEDVDIVISDKEFPKNILDGLVDADLQIV